MLIKSKGIKFTNYFMFEINTKQIVFSSILFFSLLWFFVYYPFLFHYFSPGLYPDSFGYFSIVDFWLNNEKDLIKEIPIDMPMGYPYIIYLFWKLNMSHWDFMFIQTVILYISLLYLSIIITLISKKIFVWLFCLLASTIFLLNPETLFWSVTYYTESYYIVTLVLSVSLTIHYLKVNSSKVMAFFLGLSLTFPLLIRSNGIYIVLILGFLVAWNYFYKKIFLKKIFFSYFVCSLFMLLTSYITTSYWNYGNIDRIVTILKGEKNLVDDIDKKGEAFRIQGFDEKIKYYLKGFTKTSAPFYNTKIMSNIYYNHLDFDDNHMKMYSGNVDVPNRIKKLVDYHYKNEKLGNPKEVYNSLDPSIEQSSWLKTHHKIYGLYIKAFRNNFWDYFFIILFLMHILVIPFYRKLPIDYLIISLILFSIHYLSIFLLSLAHSRPLLRYSFVSEFVLWFWIPLFLTFILNKTCSKIKPLP